MVQGLFIEMFLTAQLVFTIFMLAAEKHKATFIAPVGIGLSLFIAELTGTMSFFGPNNAANFFEVSTILEAPSTLLALLGRLSSSILSTTIIG